MPSGCQISDIEIAIDFEQNQSLTFYTVSNYMMQRIRARGGPGYLLYFFIVKSATLNGIITFYGK